MKPGAARCEVGYACIDAISFDEAVERILSLSQASPSDLRRIVVTPNIQHIALLERIPALRRAYHAASLVLPDGWPVALTVALSVRRRQPRVAGADLVPAVCAAAAERGISVGLMGGLPGAARVAAAKLQLQWPQLQVACVLDPPRGLERHSSQIRTMVDQVRTSNAAILFVGLGAPKQELLVHDYQTELGPGVALCIGAGIDFAAGFVTRAPIAVQRIGMEWLWRIAREPRRLSSRYLLSAPVMMQAALRSILRPTSRRSLGLQAGPRNGKR